jgi:hypothetical protein
MLLQKKRTPISEYFLKTTIILLVFYLLSIILLTAKISRQEEQPQQQMGTNLIRSNRGVKTEELNIQQTTKIDCEFKPGNNPHFLQS